MIQHQPILRLSLYWNILRTAILKWLRVSFQLMICLMILFEGFPTNRLRVKTVSAQTSDEGRIAFIQSGDIWVINADGSNSQQLTNKGSYLEAVWSPNSEKIAFTIQGVDATSPRRPTEIGILDLTTQTESIIVPAELVPPSHNTHIYYGFGNVRWSSDGKTLFYNAGDERPNGILSHSIDIATLKHDVGFRSFFSWGFDVSAVNGRFAWYGCPFSACALGVYNADGSGDQLLIEPQMEPRSAYAISSLNWKHDGSLIAFSAWGGTYGDGSIVFMNPSRNIEKQFSAPAAQMVEFSPNGNFIAYGTSGTDPSIYIMDASNGSTKLLTKGTMPSWAKQSAPAPSVTPTKTPSPVVCGTWHWDGPKDPKDLRIKTTQITEQARLPDCRGAFRLQNDTGLWGFGGYTLELSASSASGGFTWQPPFPKPNGVLFSSMLDLEIHAWPAPISNPTTVYIRGWMTVKGVAVDIAIFLISSAMDFGPPGVECVIPKKLIASTAVESYEVLNTAAELAIRGDFIGSMEEIKQVKDRFFGRVGQSFKDAGLNCGIDIVGSILKKPVVIARILAEYLTWIPKVLFDYFKYSGQPAIVMLKYDPVNTTIDVPTPASTLISAGTDKNTFIKHFRESIDSKNLDALKAIFSSDGVALGYGYGTEYLSPGQDNSSKVIDYLNSLLTNSSPVCNGYEDFSGTNPSKINVYIEGLNCNGNTAANCTNNKAMYYFIFSPGFQGEWRLVAIGPVQKAFYNLVSNVKKCP